MIFYFNPHDVLTAVYNLLVADTTLPGVNYLGSAGRIFTQKAPENQTLPFCLVTLDALIPSESQQYIGEARVYSYVALLGNGQIDARGDRVLSKCEEILSNSVPVISGATVQALYCLGVVPHFYDPADDKSRSRGVVRFRVECGKG